MPTVHLVDASYFIFRAYFSTPPAMTDGDGRQVNAVYGFAKFLLDFLERTRAVYVGVAFDESLSRSFRNRIYPPYKANRELPPAELEQQFARCRALCSLLGVADFGSNEYEADDIIGTFVVQARARGQRAVLLTRDKDLSQLVREGDEFWDWADDKRYGYADIPARFGVRAERMADYLALTGDSVDNIPGVPGVGPKTAAVLLSQYDSLEQLYEHLHEVPGLPLRGAKGMAEKLSAHRDKAFLARQLTRIACDVPLDGSRQALARRPPDLVAFNAFLDAARFGSLLRRQAERVAAASE
jgi:5'-3' exonuclease